MTFTNMPLEWLTLADAVLKATIILAMAAAASFALRQASAALRHLVWTLALCSALAIPALSIALPKWHVPIVTIAGEAPPVAGIAAPAPPRLRQSGGASMGASTGVPPASSGVRQESLRTRVRGAMQAITWQQAVLAIWVSGVLIVLARLAIGFAAIRWLSRRTPVITDAPWLPMARAQAAGMGVSARLRFLRSKRACMPVAAGIFRPSIIMPADADSWSDSRLRIVVLHELAHVKRRDCLTHVLAQVACALYWFNPLAWIAARRARTERERACDDLVLACGTRGSDYADELLEMARAMRGDRFGGLLAGASLAMAHRSQLEGRLMAILDPRLPRAAVSRARAIAAVALCCCAVAPLGALQPWTTGVSQVEAATVARAAVPADAAPAGAVTQSTPVAAPRSGRLPAQPPSQSAEPAQAPQPPQMVQPLQPTPIFNDVLPPIAQVAFDAIAGGVAGGTDNAFEGAFQNQKPDAKPNPEPKPQTRGGSGRPADPRMVEALTAALKDTDKEVRETAMHALVQLRDPAIYEPLTQALKDASAEVREQAAHGLGQLRDRRAVEPLVGALRDENASVREQAAFALGQLRDRAAVAGLTAAIKDGSASVRQQVVFALGQIRDPAAVDALGVAVRDENPSVRQQAVFALGQLRDARAVGPLISALKDAIADVREQAAFALGQLRDRSAVDALVVALKDSDADVRQQIVFALGQLRDPRAIDALTTALKDPSADVRRQAAFALGQLAR